MVRHLIRVEDAVKVLTFAISLLGFLSVVRNVELAYSVVFACLFLLSVSFEYRRRPPLPRWLLACMAVSAILATVLRMNTEDFISLVAGALLILLAVKLLGAKRFRDYMQIYLIALFLLIGSALLSMDIEFLFSFVAMIFLVTITIVLLTYFSQDNTMALPASVLARIASKASLISLLALPFTAVMFIVLPRTSYPLFHFLNRGVHAGTGFTDNVRLGKVSDIQEDTTVILRAHMERVGEDLLYWRGIVLDYFDGTSWISRESPAREEGRLPAITGKKIRQTVYLEPYGNRYLFALDKPFSLSLRYAKPSSSLTYALPEHIARRTKYEAVSVLSDLLPEPGTNRDMYLQLPARDLTGIRNLAKTLSSGRTREDAVNAMLRFLRNGEYRYSLKSLPVSEVPLEDFLFRSKYGNCEYFASAMAVMLRITGIPSRVVGGYRGGYYNEAGEYYLVPQKNAHVWVEAYLEDKGWLRMDPTPAGIENFVSGPSGDPFFRVRLLLDSMNYYWNALVINYDFTRQVTLFYRIKAGLGKPNLHFSVKKDLLVRYSVVLLCAVLAFLGIFRLALRRQAPDERILKEFLKAMERHGFRKGRSEGLEEFVSRIRDHEMRESAFRFVRAFEEYYYRDKRLSRRERKELRLLMEMGKRR